MSKVSNIINGFYNTLIRKPDIEVISKARLAVCEECPFIQKGVMDRCGVCGCVLQAKTRAIKDECPKKKWMKIRD